MHRNSLPNTEDFIALFTNSQRRLFDYIFALVHNFHDAEDILQQTSLVLWRKFATYKPGTDFFHWAYRIAHLEAMNFLRTRRSQNALLSEELLAELAEEYLDQVEKYDFFRDQLLICMGKLTKDQREIIQRYYGDNESAHSVASQIGQKVNTFYHALRRIRLALFNCIQRANAESR